MAAVWAWGLSVLGAWLWRDDTDPRSAWLLAPGVFGWLTWARPPGSEGVWTLGILLVAAGFYVSTRFLS